MRRQKRRGIAERGISTVGDALAWAEEQLRRIDGARCRQEAEVFLAGLLALPRIELYLNRQAPLCLSRQRRLRRWVALRRRHVPLQYLMGEAVFYGLTLKTARGVFLPRPETEVLVERLIGLLKRLHPGGPLRILELCAGSGNIAIALTKELSYCKIYISDISRKAVALARKNARAHGVAECIRFFCGDLYQALPAGVEPFDLIVANPPYVTRAEMKGLPPEVRDYEPAAALCGGADGLSVARRIVRGSRKFLRVDGYLAMELGESQRERMTAIIRQTAQFDRPEFFADLNGKERFFVCRRAYG
ncbi:MAG: peptide chain release factor N(5)-glutamine methyltransferase [Candidatus Omnitrophica bacterium]|nr:peptide chain release factor N(5)-glutamine methyltransferase [Candidatus Omnitrophota bacterium]